MPFDLTNKEDRATLQAAVEQKARKSATHYWVERFNLVCCRDCGIVRRDDDRNKPCRGVVRVEPR